ncbi:MAG: response regulator transcription factor [Aliishimia sp.]
MELISVTITDDHAFTRSGLQHQLVDDGRFRVLGQADNAVQSLQLARKLSPQIAVVDYVLPDANGLEILIELGRWAPACRCVILTGRDDAAIVQPLLDAGAAGILSKASPPEQICDALCEVALGETMLDPIFSKAVKTNQTKTPLSPREVEVLLRIAKGMTNGTIAEDLSLSSKTVESHRGSLMRKLNVSSTATLMVKAARVGLIDI